MTLIQFIPFYLDPLRHLYSNVSFPEPGCPSPTSTHRTLRLDHRNGLPSCLGPNIKLLTLPSPFTTNLSRSVCSDSSHPGIGHHLISWVAAVCPRHGRPHRPSTLFRKTHQCFSHATTNTLQQLLTVFHSTTCIPSISGQKTGRGQGGYFLLCGPSGLCLATWFCCHRAYVTRV